jgi:enoyl-[acyl-carrier protein] reductase II
MARSFADSALHLASDPDDPGIDPAKECYPSGQGVGAIDDLVPAGELVERFVAEAEEALSRAGRTTQLV